MKKKVSLVCSAGGHLCEIKELIEPLSAQYDISVVTLDREDSRSLGRDLKVYFVPDISKKFLPLIKYIIYSLKAFIKTKPSVIITTGAGAAFAYCIIGKMFFKKIIFIESLARINTFSAFGKYMKHLANATFVQWPNLRNIYKKAIFAGHIFNFNFGLNHDPPAKRIFVTVGSSEYSFNRLLASLDTIAGKGLKNYEIIAQTGSSTYIPKNYKSFKWCTIREINEHFSNSSIVIAHAGVGSMISALSSGARVIVVPRLKKFNEHTDDHQLEIAAEFAKKGIVTFVDDLSQLENVILEINHFCPRVLTEQTDLTETVKDILVKRKKKEINHLAHDVNHLEIACE